VRIEDPPVNSMASFKFTSVVPPQGTMFVFGLWVCVADGAGNFHRFIVDMKPKTLAASFHRDLNEFVDNLDDLSTHGSSMRTEEESIFNATLPHAATTTLGSKSLQSERLRNRSRLSLRNSATDRQEANNSESLSALEKDLDYLFRIGKPNPTAHRGAVGCLGDSGLMITSTLEGRFVHWKGMKLSDLLEDEDQLVAHLKPLPFQVGRPLATVAEESTELVEASSDELISRQVLMVEEGEDDGIAPNDALDAILEDEAIANAGNENDAEREARRARNRDHAIRRRRVNECMRSMHCELDTEFAAMSERGFRTPVANITRVTAILERSNDPNLRQALHYAQRAWIQLDQQNPASTVREEHVGESCSQAHSRMAGGRPRPQRSNNNDNARGSQATGGRQQPPPGGNPRQANHRNPPEDLR
jgi:hypothetical protein